MIKSVFVSIFMFSAQVFAEPYFPQKIKLTEPVENHIKQNTFMIIPINIYAGTYSKSEAEEFVRLNCQNSNLPPNELLNCEALRNCEGHSCVREYENHGTGFLAEGGDKIYTAWHVLYQSQAAGLLMFSKKLVLSDSQSRQNVYKSINPQFLLLNHNHEIVYDSRQEPTDMISYGDLVTRIFVDTGRGYNNNYFGYLENIPEDYALVQLSRSLGSGLKKAVSQNQDYNQLAMSGFYFDRHNLEFKINYGSEIDLYTLRAITDSQYTFQIRRHDISLDKFNKLNLYEQLRFIGMSDEFAREQLQKHDEQTLSKYIRITIDNYYRHQRDHEVVENPNVILTTHKILPGQSGGPITNSLGEYLGIITNSIFTFNKEQETVKSYGAAGYLF